MFNTEFACLNLVFLFDFYLFLCEDSWYMSFVSTKHVFRSWRDDMKGIVLWFMDHVFRIRRQYLVCLCCKYDNSLLEVSAT